MEKKLAKPFFTIGITTYNRKEMLNECLHSILSQLFSDFEVIIGNDYVLEKLYLDDFKISDDRFKIINHETNLGEINNMNYLLNSANGKYFTWLADDDVLHEQFLNFAYDVINSEESVAFFSNYASGEKIPESFYKRFETRHHVDFNSNTFVEQYIKRKIKLIGCYGLVKTELLKDIGGMPLLGSKFSPYSDTLLPILIASYGNIIYCDLALQFLRTHDESISASSADIDEYLSAEEDFIDRLKQICSNSIMKIDCNYMIYYMSCWFFDNQVAVLFRNKNIYWFKSVLQLLSYQWKITYKRIRLIYWTRYMGYVILSLSKIMLIKVFKYILTKDN